jgi:hypothetical protein
MEATVSQAPRAREHGLLVHELPDEVLVYDLDRHRAHSLNSTAALVWRHCDGRTTPAQMAALLQRELSLPADEEAVWLVLRRLGRARLLQERVPPAAGATRRSRREVLRKLGIVGGAMLVTSILAPTAAQAQSGIRTNVCASMTPPCPGTACDVAGTHCVNSGSVGNPHCACL